MVFFCCLGCGDAVKKAQVEKHKQQCRRSHVLSCVDCGKDFHGNDYNLHIKCISEEQKYGGSKFVPKENKGEAKQQQWFEQVQRAIESSKPTDQSLRRLLERLRNYPNIPRKEMKFKNFVKNSLRVHDDRLLSHAWTAIDKSTVQNKTDNCNPSKETPGDVVVVNDRKRPNNFDNDKDVSAKRSKIDEPAQNGAVMEELDETQPNSGVNGNFKLKSSIKRLLKETDCGRMKLTKLKKIIVSQLNLDNGEEIEKICTEIDKKLSKESSKFVVEGKYVRLK